MERVTGKYVRHTKTNINGGSTIAVALVEENIFFTESKIITIWYG